MTAQSRPGITAGKQAMESPDRFEPKIIAFLCAWCSYEGADAAGRSRLDCPAGLRVVRVMCSGRIDPQFILQAFASGADGVAVLGCPQGNCHYKDGNLQTLKRIILLKKLLEQYGVEADRLMLDWVSAGEGEKYARLVNAMADRVKRMGPL